MAHPTKGPSDEDREKSRKSVRFSLDALHWHLPKTKKTKTAVSKKTARVSEVFLSGPTHEESATLGATVVDAAGNEIGIPPTEVSYEVFCDKVSQRLDDLRYHTSPEELDQDQVERVRSLADWYATPAGPTVPFAPLCETDGRHPIEFKGVLYEHEWMDLCINHPHEMWQEFKVRALICTALLGQVRDLHHHLTSLDRNLQIVHDWVPALHQQKATSTDERVTTMRDALAARDDALESKEREVEDLKEALTEKEMQCRDVEDNMELTEERLESARKELTEVVAENQEAREASVYLAGQNYKLNQKIEELQKQLAQARKPRSESSQFLRSSPPPRTEDRPASLTSRETRFDSFSINEDDAAEKGRKSTKLPDPPIFTNGKDSPSFEVWRRAMCNKVVVNRDHFASDRALLAYIEGRIGGKAADALAPYLRDGHPDQIVHPDKLMQHLWHEYNDHNCKEKALTDFNNLKLDKASKFAAFKNDFVRLAGEIGRSKSEWKQEFRRRLPGSFQKALAAQYVNPAVTFEDFTRLAAEIAMIEETVDAMEKKKEDSGNARGSRGGQRNNFNSGKSKSSGGQSNQGPKPEHKLSREEVRKRYEAGECFICGETGHRSRQCPKANEKKPRGSDKDREARIANLQKTWAKDDEEGEAPTPPRAPKAGKPKKPASNKAKLDESDDSSSGEEN